MPIREPEAPTRVDLIGVNTIGPCYQTGTSSKSCPQMITEDSEEHKSTAYMCVRVTLL